MIDDPFQPWLERWGLVPDGAPFTTRIGSRLAPVLSEGAPAMLKIAIGEEEVRGAGLMAWYDGRGAARVLARDGEALLLERVIGGRSLAEMARRGQDDEATAVLCGCAATLHDRAGRRALPELVPLGIWFRSLEVAADRHGGVFAGAVPVARALLAEPRETVVLHGDLHHDNVLDGGDGGWLAIDPKGLIGERTFEFANLFRNPDIDIALAPSRLRRQVTIVSLASNVDPFRLLQWIQAYATLGAAWSLESGHDAAPGLAIAALAVTELEA